MSFNPREHTIKVQGGRMYLPVAARLVWFREDHPDWGIVTEPLEINHEGQYAIFRASIFNEEGRLIATATKKEDVRGFGDWLEKSETGSVGRALALCGYGTQFAPEIDEGERFADSPQGGRREGSAPRRNSPAPAPRTTFPPETEAAFAVFASLLPGAGQDVPLTPSGEVSRRGCRSVAEELTGETAADWTQPGPWQRAASVLRARAVVGHASDQKTTDARGQADTPAPRDPIADTVSPMPPDTGDDLPDELRDPFAEEEETPAPEAASPFDESLPPAKGHNRKARPGNGPEALL